MEALTIIGWFMTPQVSLNQYLLDKLFESVLKDRNNAIPGKNWINLAFSSNWLNFWMKFQSLTRHMHAESSTLQDSKFFLVVFFCMLALLHFFCFFSTFFCSKSPWSKESYRLIYEASSFFESIVTWQTGTPKSRPIILLIFV